MPVQEILDLAQQGHPTAIATLMNYLTQPRGMKVRVRRQEDTLHILLEAEVLPEQQQTVLFVQENLQNLQVQSITTVTIYGRQQGDRFPVWQHTIALGEHVLGEQEHDVVSTQAVPDDLLHDLAILEPLSSAESTAMAGEPQIDRIETKVEGFLPEFTPLELSTSQKPKAEPRYNTASSTAPVPSDEPVPSEGLLEPVPSMDTSSPTMQSSDVVNPEAFTPSESIEPSIEPPIEPIESPITPQLEPSIEPIAALPASNGIPEDDTPEILKRPESVFFLFIASILMFWEAYLTLLEEEETKPKKVLSTSQLARRLKTSKSLIRRQKRLDGFSEWTRSLDPQGVAWTYSRGVYLPVSGVPS